MHWRRQLWGTGARAPLDFQLVILGITRFTDSDESFARFSVPAVGLERFLAIGSADCHWIVALLCSRYRSERVVGYSFPQGVIIVPKMPERSPINFNSTRTSDSDKTGS